MPSVKYYHDVDLVKNSLLDAKIFPLTTSQRVALVSSYNINDKGIICFDTTEANLYAWDGNDWKFIGVNNTDYADWTEAYNQIIRALSVTTNETQKVITLTREDGTTLSATWEHAYIYNQGVPATLWTINHSLNKYPSVTVVDSANTEVVGDIQYTNTNTLTVTFSSAFSGKAYLN
jgi:hypothetical protein